MSGSYFVESLDNLPFSAFVKLIRQSIPGRMGWIVAAYLRLKSRLGMSHCPPYATRWQEELVLDDREDMSPRALSRWARYIEQLDDLGFRELGYFKPDLIGAKEEAVALFLSENGHTLALLTWLRMNGANGIEEAMPVEFKSAKEDGNELSTTVMKEAHAVLADAIVPDYVEFEFMPHDTPLSRAYRRHCDRPGMETVKAASPQVAVEKYEQQRSRLFHHFVDIGLLRPATTSQLAIIQQCLLPD